MQRMRNGFIITVVSLMMALSIQAQILKPVKFHVMGNDTAIVFQGTIKKGWHVYSVKPQKEDADIGPTWARLTVSHAEGVELVGLLQAVGQEQATFDDMFGMDVRYFEDSVTFIQKIHVLDNGYSIDCMLEYGTCNDEQCLPPQQVDYRHSAVVTTDDTGEQTESLWAVFLAGLIGGLLALLTPCVWPMIPMTVSFFLKRNNARRKAVQEASFYGISIIVIYLLLGIAVTLIFGATALNNLATNAVANIIFAGLLIVFALSFFGLFELRLPNSWANRLDQKADRLGTAQKGGAVALANHLSIALMALVLTIVSFSCTGPLIGVLLVTVAQTGSILAPAIGMFGFAIALAIPFAIFSLFPNWLSTLPKSGSWMMTVKVTLAFIELAFALKFISVADTAYGWGILPRTLFIAIWLALAIALAVYLCLQMRKGKALIMKGILLLLTIAISIYLLWGIIGKSTLKDISAFLPPMEQRLSMTHFNDYDEGLRAAQRQGKPVFIDFTGYGCVNCRKMEAAVFTDAEIRKMLDERYIVITLFVDDRRHSPSDAATTLGDKWSQLQQTKYGANAQPYYIIADATGEPLAPPRSYNEDVEMFRQFLSIPFNNKE